MSKNNCTNNAAKVLSNTFGKVIDKLLKVYHLVVKAEFESKVGRVNFFGWLVVNLIIVLLAAGAAIGLCFGHTLAISIWLDCLLPIFMGLIVCIAIILVCQQFRINP